jgi:hypothetical protein
MPIVSKTYNNEEYLTRHQDLIDVTYEMINGTFNQTLFNEIKSFQTNFLVNELKFYPSEGVNVNETLEKYVDDLSDLCLEALISANPPYTEEKHKTFNETIDKMIDGGQNVLSSMKGVEKLFRPEIQQLPIVYEFLRVFNETYTYLESVKVDPTGYGDSYKNAENVKLTANLYYLASQVSVILAETP